MNPVILPKLISKFVRDEFSAAAMYLRVANLLPPELGKELRDHASDEFNHAQQLIDFACNHGFGDAVSIEFDPEVTGFISDNPMVIIDKVQALELAAIDDYTKVARIASKMGVIEVYELFSSLASDERGHFDDFAVLLRQHRPIQ